MLSGAGKHNGCHILIRSHVGKCSLQVNVAVHIHTVSHLRIVHDNRRNPVFFLYLCKISHEISQPSFVLCIARVSAGTISNKSPTIP